jgi:hypothetical protein
MKEQTYKSAIARKEEDYYLVVSEMTPVVFGNQCDVVSTDRQLAYDALNAELRKTKSYGDSNGRN